MCEGGAQTWASVDVAEVSLAEGGSVTSMFVYYRSELVCCGGGVVGRLCALVWGTYVYVVGLLEECCVSAVWENVSFAWRPLCGCAAVDGLVWQCRCGGCRCMPVVQVVSVL